jgi:hypothetical protein
MITSLVENLRYELNIITSCSRRINDLFNNSLTLNIAGNGIAVGNIRRP